MLRPIRLKAAMLDKKALSGILALWAAKRLKMSYHLSIPVFIWTIQPNL